MPKSRIVRIELYGGLGNQILIYFAGLALAQKTSRILEIDFFWRDSKHSIDHDITSFKLKGNFVRRNLHRLPRWAIRCSWRVIDSLSYRSSLFKKFEFRHLGIFREILMSKRTSDISLHKLLDSHKHRVILKGYFFTNKYILDLLGTDGSNLELVTPTTEFLKLQDQIRITKPIAIHIRKWECEIEAFGQLSESFFLNALSSMRKKSLLPHPPIWLFVENMNDLSLFPNIKSLAHFILTPSQLSDPAETLFLMSLCPKLIISNSTFSYCAALLSDQKKTEIYAPWPFRPKPNGTLKNEIHLQHWHSIESEWL